MLNSIAILSVRTDTLRKKGYVCIMYKYSSSVGVQHAAFVKDFKVFNLLLLAIRQRAL